MGRKTKHEVVCEFRCSEILEAARRVFARKGFGATVDEIAEAAGLAKGTLYLYFHSKREIYLAALRQSFAGLLEETRRSVETAPAVEEKIRAFIATCIRHAEDNKDFISIFHAEFGKIGLGSQNKEFRSLYWQQARTLEPALREAAALGQIRTARPDAAAFTVHEMTRGLITQRLLGWSAATAEEDVEFLTQLIWSGLASPSACAVREE